jgi:hypothetical protein
VRATTTASSLALSETPVQDRADVVAIDSARAALSARQIGTKVMDGIQEKVGAYAGKEIEARFSYSLRDRIHHSMLGGGSEA